MNDLETVKFNYQNLMTEFDSFLHENNDAALSLIKAGAAAKNWLEEQKVLSKKIHDELNEYFNRLKEIEIGISVLPDDLARIELKKHQLNSSGVILDLLLDLNYSMSEAGLEFMPLNNIKK